MGQVDGLGALEVRVAGHRPVEVRSASCDEHALQVLRGARRVVERVRAGEHRHVGGDLVVARARGVQLAADRAGDLGEPPLDRHVDVLVVASEREVALVELALDRVEAREQLVAVGLGDDPPRREHRACARDWAMS